MVTSQIKNYIIKRFILFLHLLMMRSTLICSPTAYKIRHCFKNFIHSSHFFYLEMTMIDLEKPMIPFFLLFSPMSYSDSLLHDFFLSYFFYFVNWFNNFLFFGMCFSLSKSTFILLLNKIMWGVFIFFLLETNRQLKIMIIKGIHING